MNMHFIHHHILSHSASLSLTVACIGKLELQIPWKKLTKDPLVVMVDDVYVVLEPDLDTHYDREKALMRDRKEKEKKIKDYEEAAKKRKQKESECLASMAVISILISCCFSNYTSLEV